MIYINVMKNFFNISPILLIYWANGGTGRRVGLKIQW